VCAESKNDHKLAYRLMQVGRQISAAKTDEIDLESWDSFYAWWNENRSEQLLYSISDALGEQNPAVAHLAEILEKQEEIDAQLHAVYMGLKGAGQAGEQAAEGELDNLEEDFIDPAEGEMGEGEDSGEEGEADLDVEVDEIEETD